MSFIHDITLGQYFPSESSVHLLDPRSKLLILLIIMVLLVLTIDPFFYIVASASLLSVVYLSRLRFSLVFRNLRPFLWLFLITFIFNAVGNSGEPLFVIPLVNWQISDESLLRAFAYSFRIILIIGFASLFTLTTAPVDIADGLARLMSPLRRLRVPVNEFAMMLTLAIRFIPILLQEAERIRNAQLSRGAKFDGNLKQRLRGLVPLVIPLFVSVFRKADDIALAMEARCFRLGKERTSYRVFKFGYADYVTVAGALLIAVLFVSA
jgi:energy-coupling factor transport system permease protein